MRVYKIIHPARLGDLGFGSESGFGSARAVLSLVGIGSVLRKTKAEAGAMKGKSSGQNAHSSRPKKTAEAIKWAKCTLEIPAQEEAAEWAKRTLCKREKKKREGSELGQCYSI